MTAGSIPELLPAGQVHGTLLLGLGGPCGPTEQRHAVAVRPGGPHHTLQLPAGDPGSAADGRLVHGQQAPGARGSQVWHHDSAGLPLTLSALPEECWNIPALDACTLGRISKTSSARSRPVVSSCAWGSELLSGLLHQSRSCHADFEHADNL